MPSFAASAATGGGGGDPLDHRAAPAERRVEALAAAERQPEGMVARLGGAAGQHQIAEPAQAAKVSARGALGEPEPDHFGEAAGDQRGAGIIAETAPDDDAAGDRQHVLDRAADLRADRVR